MKRIFQKGANGMAYPVPYARCEKTGKVVEAPLTGESKAVKQTTVWANKYPLMTPQQLQSSMKEYNQSFAVEGAETAQGMRTNVRLESSRKIGRGGSKRINITLSNTSTTVDSDVLIGDSIGIIELDAGDGGLGIGPKPAAVTVGGKWGTNTLDILKNAFGYAPHDFHGVQIEATNVADDSANNSYRTGGKFQVVKAPVNGDSPMVDTYELFPLIGADSFNRNIFEIKNFREQVGMYDAFLVRVPAGVRIDISLIVNAAGTGSVMEEV